MQKMNYNEKQKRENQRILKWVNFVRKLGFGSVEIIIDKARNYFRVKVHTEDRSN